MSVFEELTQAITCRYSDRIKKACDLLIKSFDLSHFGYYKLTNDGGFSYLGSNVEWSEYFASKRMYLDFPLYRHPKHFRSGIQLFNPKQTLIQPLKIGNRLFSIHGCLFLMNKIDVGIEGYCFASNSSDEMGLIHLVNALPSLKLFIQQFREDQRFLFSALEDRQIDLAQLMGPIFNQPYGPVTQVSDSQVLFLKKIKESLEARFSPRDLNVMMLLVQGYSASQIAQQILRSRRTVEHQIERMKGKLGCDSKTELIQKIRELEQNGALQE